MDKKLRYGAFSTLIAVFVIAALICVNIVVSLFDIKFDLTLDKRYTISQESKDIISAENLTEDITIYALVKEDDADIQYRELLGQYAENSRRISVVYRDPNLYPTFVEQYNTDGEAIPEFSIIVTGPELFRVIRTPELYTTEMDWTTGRQVFRSFDLEPMVTNAVRFVTGAATANIYQVTNHDEDPIGESIKRQLSMQNFTLNDLNLFEAEQVPEDADMLILSTPVRDYTPEEAEKVTDYLYNGGRAMIFADGIFGEKPNFNSIISAYGAELGDALILEGNPTFSFGGMPHRLLPFLASHDITDNLPQNTYVMMIYASDFTPSPALRNTLTIEPLLATSRQSYAKIGEFSSVNPEPGDPEGPFTVGLAVTDARHIPEVVTAKVIMIGSSSMLSEELNVTVGGGNGDFILNAVNWLIDGDDSIYIRPKANVGPASLVINDSHRRILQVCSMFVLPGVIIAAGVIVWVRRRNR